MDALINSRQVRATCAHVSDMTLWRWLQDSASEFPKPVYVNTRRYWREADVRAWWVNKELSAEASQSN